MSELFHNPYHFVPAWPEPGPGTHPLPERTAAALPAQVTHDRFLAGDPRVDGDGTVFSGRIVCRLEILELAGVGGNQEPGDKTRARVVEPFRVGRNREWALPGSSLRGLVSSIAEAASNSTLRVLTDTDVRPSKGKDEGRNVAGKVRDFFCGIGAHLVPLAENDRRTQLTIAEAMFGLVEEADTRSVKGTQREMLALAGRVWFSDALLAAQSSAPATERGRLQILDSPKAAVSNFYFRCKGGEGYVAKAALSVAQHEPLGRKVYLHRRRLDDREDHRDWRTDPQVHARNLEQKSDVEMLAAGTAFWFSVDFENLSRPELELLVYSLRPSEAFRHKLGFGKPLGLGKVRIDPMGLFLVNRQDRYGRAPLGAARYGNVWRASGGEAWPEWVRREAEAPLTERTAALEPGALRAAWRTRVARETPPLVTSLDALELLGDPGRLPPDRLVHYPQPRLRRVRGRSMEVTGPELETKGYEWFQQNNEQTDPGQYLRPLTAANTGNWTELPALDRDLKSDPPPPPGSGSGGAVTPSGGGGGVAPATSPGALRGSVAKSRLAAWKGGRPRFEIVVGGTTYPAFLKPRDIAEVCRRHPGFPVDIEIDLKVGAFNAGSFQASLPAAGEIRQPC